MLKFERTEPMSRKKKIALIAHDHMKDLMVEWCQENEATLKQHQLCGTGTTAQRISEATGLSVFPYNSGPIGGDQQIGAKIVEGEIDILIFFSDPLSAHPHDPDVKALLRIAQVFNIPIANNEATADFILNSKYMDDGYIKRIALFKR